MGTKLICKLDNYNENDIQNHPEGDPGTFSYAEVTLLHNNKNKFLKINSSTNAETFVLNINDVLETIKLLSNATKVNKE